MGALPGFRQQDDFSKLADELARLIARKNDLEDWEIDELIARPLQDRNKYFSERRRIHELREAKIAVREASNYLARKAIFIEKGVHERLESFTEGAWRAIVVREIMVDIGGGDAAGIKRDDEDFRKTADAQIKELEQLVRNRFWSQGVSLGTLSE
jgi:hypothetical protein